MTSLFAASVSVGM
ncbi:unnamed protein product [Gulo gulo]|uniref:Uncharacterized protein n=1 Tax=Gulo gulo TaxID=48420 RepID=A0A9X9PU47_GULGU|nr:unnamed protein product [Gulo gulo]